MISPIKFKEVLEKKGINFFTGVPDSTLKGFCNYISTQPNHIIAANEGTAIGIAAGYYLCFNKPALVYLQNSGLGNATNPLVSLTSKEVYSIPVLLLIGWRGKPGVKDEPQHIHQGRIMLKQLELMDIPYSIMNEDSYEEQLDHAINYMQENSSPFAIITDKIFEEVSTETFDNDILELTREESIRIVLDNINQDKSIFISTTGFTSRELFMLRQLRNENNNDFLTVGSMGHASQISLGVALHTDKNVICIDGDGAALMHLGGMASIGTSNAKNILHIVINNSSYESVGGSPTPIAGRMDTLSDIAKSCGYDRCYNIWNASELSSIILSLNDLNEIGKVFLEIHVKKGHKKDLPRPNCTPIQNKNNFMNQFVTWKSIWNNKSLLPPQLIDLKKLIELDGFDSVGGISVEDWMEYISYILDKIKISSSETLLELGCGAGALLLPFYMKGIDVSGIDYSDTLISNARNMIHGNFYVCEIEKFNIQRQYDHIISNSVFQYFESEEHAKNVILKYLPFIKSTFSILDINDKEKEQLAMSIRKTICPPHLFYYKKWWKYLAKELNLDIEIEDQVIKNYTNSSFRYNVFLRKK